MNQRDDVACMLRVRNEARWIRGNLERTFQVCRRVVLLDDGSEDSTVFESLKSVGVTSVWHLGNKGTPGLVRVHPGRVPAMPESGLQGELDCELHVIHSPFRPAVARPMQGVSEIRDKNLLWEYCKANVAFRHMLCLDGDELLSKQMVRYFDRAITALIQGVDMMTLPFLYLWDSDEQIRVDGIYGLKDDQIPTLRFPRLFTLERVTPDALHVMRFSWQGTKGGFHCGSIPREYFRPLDTDPRGGTFAAPIIHYGYRDEADRQRKHKFYNEIDPDNEFEGRYDHVIGLPNRHAPGPVLLQPFTDQ